MTLYEKLRAHANWFRENELEATTKIIKQKMFEAATQGSYECDFPLGNCIYEEQLQDYFRKEGFVANVYCNDDYGVSLYLNWK